MVQRYRGENDGVSRWTVANRMGSRVSGANSVRSISEAGSRCG